MKNIPVILTFFSTLFAITINIPADYSTIQEGIDASVEGDTILIAQGTYYENLILEKNIVMASHAIFDDLSEDWLNNENINNTIISGAQEPSDPKKGSCLIIRHDYMNIHPEIMGLTFQDGTGTDMRVPACGPVQIIRSGGGILIYKAYPTINYNRFINNGLSSDNLRVGKGVRTGGAMGHYSDEGVEFDEDRGSNNWNNGQTHEPYFIDFADFETRGVVKKKGTMKKGPANPASSNLQINDMPPSRNHDLIPGDGTRGGVDIYMYDSWDDGWNGNYLTIDGEHSFTITNGNYASAFLSLDDGEHSVTCGGGTWQEEVSWEIHDASDGTLLLSGGAPFEGGFVLGSAGIPDPPAILDITKNYFDGNSSGDGESIYSHGFEGTIDVSNSIFENIDCESDKVNDFVLQSIEDEADFLQDDIAGNCIESNTFYVASSGDDNNAGTESEPLKTIGHALTLVRETEDVTTIYLAEGTYSPSINSEQFPIVLPNNVHLIGAGVEATIIDAEADADNQAATVIIKEVENVILADVTLTGGFSESHGCAGGGGLAIVAEDMFNLYEGDGGTGVDAFTTPLIENVIIEGNHSSNGGGLSFFRTHGPVLNNVIIRNNTSASFGGGVFCYGGGITMTNVTVTENVNGDEQGGGMMLAGSEGTLDNMTITNNISNVHGGGIWTNSSGGPDGSDGWIMTNSTITGNTAANLGGGISFAWSHSTISNSIISGNTSGWGGGGINGIQSGFTIKYSIIKDNYTQGHGGGIRTGGELYDGLEPPVIEDCIVPRNESEAYGGGIILIDNIDAVISRTSVVNNHAAGYTGGIRLYNTTATITNVTVSENTSGGGGGIGVISDSGVDIANSIVWDNTGEEVAINSSSANVTYSDIQGGYEGEGNMNADPLFTDADNDDFTLQPESPCIDAGTADLDFDGTDDIGYAGSAPDMGAYELGGILGCTDPEAENFDPEANMDDGTCIFGPPEIIVSYNTGWNMVGLPLEVEDANYQTLFPNAQEGTLYSFGEGYDEQTELVTGNGYLLRMTMEDSVTFTGIPILGVTVPLSEGWNIVSGISSPLPVEDIYTNDIVYSGTVYGLGANYYTPESIEPGRGYWVRAIEAGEITLGASPAEFMMTLILDDYPSETTWDLIGPEGEIGSGGPYSEAGGTVEFSAELPPGNYVWTIYDKYADGICCGFGNGSYEYTLDGAVIATGGQFGQSESVDFTVGARSNVNSLTTTHLPYDVEMPWFKGGTPLSVHIDFITETIEYPTDYAVSPKLVSIMDRLEEANSISFSTENYSTELYFGVEVPEDDLLSYSLPPTFPQMAFDVRFSGDTKLVPGSGEIEVITQSEMLTIEYDIKVDAGDRMSWVLRTESGKDYTLEGTGEITLPSEERFVLNKEIVIPSTFTLHQNFPNPFNPVTTLRYDLPSDAFVTLSIYDMLGREITQLVNTSQIAGFKSVQWDATNSMGKPMSAGVYLYQIKAGEYSQTRKMVLLK